MQKKNSSRAPRAKARCLAALGLYGLDHLDAVILAALASEAPLLLIGPHGSAKSALLNRTARALGLEHRHYNASLVSFDDLLGFPVPNPARDGLDYLRTPATLWGAQSIFLDEISRCRPEVQNKLFSIVHERRAMGIALDGLRYRWAAMNPPAAFADSGELDDA
jgi:MoxR-like ATPase